MSKTSATAKKSITANELFNDEIKLFNEKRDEFCNDNYWKYVLIKWKEILWFFDTVKDAVTSGKIKFWNTPFFVKQIAKKDVIHNFSRMIFA